MRPRTLVAAAGLGVTLSWLLAACVLGGPAPPPTPTVTLAPPADVPVHRVAAPPGRYFNVVWLPDDWLVVDHEPAANPGLPTGQLWQLRPDGSEFRQLPLGQDPACQVTRYLGITLLPDGRLSYEKKCISPVTPPGQAKRYSDRHVMAYDLVTEQSERLVDEEIIAGLSGLTWNPTMTRGMIGSSTGICGSIAWLTREGYEYAAITIREGRRHWRLDTYFVRIVAYFADVGAEYSCRDEGQAMGPAWSPDGKVIAFLASPQSIGVAGLARLRQPWNLYLMDPVEQQPRPILVDIKRFVTPEWSPDSRWLAFVGEVGGQPRSLWLLAPETGVLHQVSARSRLSSFAWSPDGQQLVVVREIKTSDLPAERAELLLFDVSAIVAAS